MNVERHKQILDACNQLLDYIYVNDKEAVELIKMKSSDIIKDYNLKNLTVIDPTNTEIGLFNSSVKKIIKGRFLNKIDKEEEIGIIESDEEFICKEHRFYYRDDDDWVPRYGDGWYYDDSEGSSKPVCSKCKNEIERIYNNNSSIRYKINERHSKWNSACYHTVFSDDLIGRFILAKRHTKDSYNKTKLEKAISESLKTEIMSVFQEQNKELIINLK